MSELSALILHHRVDYTATRRRRRENHRSPADSLGEIAMFRELPLDVVPLGFPIRVRDRDRVRQVLFHAEIYPPTIGRWNE